MQPIKETIHSTFWPQIESEKHFKSSFYKSMSEMCKTVLKKKGIYTSDQNIPKDLALIKQMGEDYIFPKDVFIWADWIEDCNPLYENFMGIDSAFPNNVTIPVKEKVLNPQLLLQVAVKSFENLKKWLEPSQTENFKTRQLEINRQYESLREQMQFFLSASNRYYHNGIFPLPEVLQVDERMETFVNNMMGCFKVIVGDSFLRSTINNMFKCLSYKLHMHIEEFGTLKSMRVAKKFETVEELWDNFIFIYNLYQGNIISLIDERSHRLLDCLDVIEDFVFNLTPEQGLDIYCINSERIEKQQAKEISDSLNIMQKYFKQLSFFMMAKPEFKINSLSETEAEFVSKWRKFLPFLTTNSIFMKNDVLFDHDYSSKMWMMDRLYFCLDQAINGKRAFSTEDLSEIKDGLETIKNIAQFDIAL